MSSRRPPNASTFECTYCHQSFPSRGALHIHSMDCRNPTMNTSDTKHTEIEKFSCLLAKASHVKDQLGEEYYQSEVDHLIHNLQFNIIVMGSPRVGKNELINALPDGGARAQTSSSLNSCAQKVTPYVLESKTKATDSSAQSFQIIFYDTPGIESWSEDHVRSYLSKIMKESQPLCMIYCASPGSFARLDQLQWLVDTCIQSNIFCALVCTNKYCSGPESGPLQG